MLQIKLNPPAGLFALGQTPESKSSYKLDRAFEIRNRLDIERMAFRQHVGVMTGLLESLSELWCTAEISIRTGDTAKIDGAIMAWTEPARAVAAYTLIKIQDCTFALARYRPSASCFDFKLERTWTSHKHN